MLDYYLAQVLTGHEAFNPYLRTGKLGNDICVYCKGSDTAEHRVFQCNRWKGTRKLTYAELAYPKSKLDPFRNVSCMVHTRSKQITIHNMIKTAMRNKEVKKG